MSEDISLHHGGRLRAAAHEYRIAARHWLDLSTGINPIGWPVPPVPAEVWQRLPEEDDGLYMASLAAFGTQDVLPVAGSQAALQVLPRLRAAGRVAVLSPAYAEHARAWQVAGHAVEALTRDCIEAALDTLDVLIVVNPNNPTGELIAPDVLSHWHDRLASHGGWLVVDEAFIEPTLDMSVARAPTLPGLIVLRSLGKFWGLAGIRVGFVLAEQALLALLRAELGPWHVSHPARWIAQRALVDQAWRANTTARLFADSARLAGLLNEYGLHSPSGCALFRWVPTERAAWLHDALAKKAVLVRCFEEGLRFGLPGSEAGWTQLTMALKEIKP